MIFGHKIELKPNNVQKTLLRKHFGVARLAYNTCLQIWNDDYKAGLKPNVYTIKKKFNAIKEEKYPWIYEVSKCAAESAIMDLGKAFGNYFRNPDKFERPVFKSKDTDNSFRMDNARFKLTETHVLLPKKLKIRLKEQFRFPDSIKLYNATVSSEGDKFFISISCETIEIPQINKNKNENVVGMDLGIKSLVVLSDGQVYENPKALKYKERTLRRRQQELSRKKKGSKNRRKAKYKLAKVHREIKNVRTDAINKITTDIAKNHKVVCMETLKPKNMMKNHNLAKSLSDASFGEIKRQMQYKCQRYGSKLVFAPSNYPSSQLCSSCGYRNEETKDLSIRSWVCPECGSYHNRDVNAAINLKRYAESQGMFKINKTMSAGGYLAKQSVESSYPYHNKPNGIMAYSSLKQKVNSYSFIS